MPDMSLPSFVSVLLLILRLLNALVAGMDGAVWTVWMLAKPIGMDACMRAFFGGITYLHSERAAAICLAPSFQISVPRMSSVWSVVFARK